MYGPPFVTDVFSRKIVGCNAIVYTERIIELCAPLHLDRWCQLRQPLAEAVNGLYNTELVRQVCRPRVVRRGAASPCGQSTRTDYRNHYDPDVSTRTIEPVPTLAENRAVFPLSQE